MSKSIFSISTTTAVAVAPSGTVTFTYPSGYTGQDFSLEETDFTVGNDSFPAALYSVAIGDAAATVTLAGTVQIAALQEVRLGLTLLASVLEHGLKIGDVKAPVVDKVASFTLSDSEKGAYVHVNAAGAVVASLPNNWRRGDACIARRVGAGAVTWTALAGSTVVLPATKAAHIGISEQHEEIMLRVIENATGVLAKWAISGGTA